MKFEDFVRICQFHGIAAPSRSYGEEAPFDSSTCEHTEGLDHDVCCACGEIVERYTNLGSEY